MKASMRLKVNIKVLKIKKKSLIFFLSLIELFFQSECISEVLLSSSSLEMTTDYLGPLLFNNSSREPYITGHIHLLILYCFLIYFCIWRRKWQPTPVLLPGKFHGQRSLASYSPQGRKESDTTERLSLLLYQSRSPLETKSTLQRVLFNRDFSH